jgi:hypothetical protein
MGRALRRGIAVWMLGLVASMAWSGRAEALMMDFTVDSHAGPWVYNAGLNSTFTYGVGDYTSPTVVSAADGFDFSAGNMFTIAYVSGLTDPFGISPAYDAAGDTGYEANNNGGSSGMFFPSLYVDPASYPVYLAAVIGVFTDSSGSIVGTPFAVNDLGTFTLPVGATQLQLGINDDIFVDNVGSLVMSVTGPALAVPEPASLALLAVGTAIGLLARRRALARTTRP